MSCVQLAVCASACLALCQVMQAAAFSFGTHLGYSKAVSSRSLSIVGDVKQGHDRLTTQLHMSTEGGNKKKRRKRVASEGSEPKKAVDPAAAYSRTLSEDSAEDGDNATRRAPLVVNPGDDLTKYFTDDWSKMPGAPVQPKARLPTREEFLARKRTQGGADGLLEDFKEQEARQPEQKKGAGPPGPFPSSPPLQKPAPSQSAKSSVPSSLEVYQAKKQGLSAAEQFTEGKTIKNIKTATWFAIVALVAWEVVIHSPLMPK